MLKFISGIACAVVFLTAAAHAEDAYPDKTVTVVAASSAGGGTDLVTRMVARAFSKQLNGSFIVQDIPGAGGIVGMTNVAHAKPNGYTLLVEHIGMATAPGLYKNLQFDPLTSFAPVGLFAETPMIVWSSKKFPPKNMAELVKYVRTAKPPVTFASSGMGSATYLCALLFQQVVGAKVTMIQYKGAAPAFTDTETGRVNLHCGVTADGIGGHVKQGMVKGFVLTAEKRLGSVPDLPTSAEAGFPALTLSAWYGVYAPAGTPAPVIDTLSGALQRALKDPQVAKELAAMQTVPFSPAQATPKALHDKLAAQLSLWTPMLREAAPNGANSN